MKNLSYSWISLVILVYSFLMILWILSKIDFLSIKMRTAIFYQKKMLAKKD